MATRFYLRDDASDISTADTDYLLALTAGNALNASDATSTVAGPTTGVACRDAGATVVWFSNPLDAVSISGASAVTFNIWMAESNMSANVGAHVLIEVCQNDGTVIGTLRNSEKGTELPVTTRAAQNWTGIGITNTINAGERLKVTVKGNDAGTMASGFTFNCSFDGPTGGADGDSWVEFPETITEQSAAAATSLPLRGETAAKILMRRMTKRASGLLVPDFWHDRIHVPRPALAA